MSVSTAIYARNDGISNTAVLTSKESGTKILKAFSPDPIKLTQYKINKIFEQDGEFDLNIKKSISSLALNSEIMLEHESSNVRVILLDNNDKEYLVYEASPMITNEKAFSVKNICEETCNLDYVTPAKLRIEAKQASIKINNINFEPSPKKKLLEVISQKEKKTITSVNTLQQEHKIQQINKYIKNNDLEWTAGKTSISKLTYAEKKKLFSTEDGKSINKLPNLYGFEYYKGGIFEIPVGKRSIKKKSDSSDLPSEWDWRNVHGEDWMTPVKNQGGCGSCWAFAAVGTVESAANLYFNQHLDLDLSEQDLVSCHEGRAGTCAGARYLEPALYFIKNKGIVSEECFPYQESDISCQRCSNWNEDLYKINGFDNLNRRSHSYKESKENAKEIIMTKGPVVAGMTFDYGGRHAIVLVGWLKQQGDDPIWIFKNSWGGDWTQNPLTWADGTTQENVWGEDGYGYIRVRHNYDEIINLNVVSIKTPVFLPDKNIQINCVDKDDDDFCNWGISEDMPSTCSSSCKPQKDCDDSDDEIGVCSWDDGGDDDDDDDDDDNGDDDDDDDDDDDVIIDKGYLKVISNPSEAEVYVNGEYKGLTNMKISLEPGRYYVTIKKQGYRDYVKKVSIYKGRTTEINAILRQGQGGGSCTPGYMCVIENGRQFSVYQKSNCKLTRKRYCRKGCLNGRCL